MTTNAPPTCTWNTAAGPCGSTTGLRRYQEGWRCRRCAPWARAGEPEPLTPVEIQQRKEQQ